jgi:hypothetical protein
MRVSTLDTLRLFTMKLGDSNSLLQRFKNCITRPRPIGMRSYICSTVKGIGIVISSMRQCQCWRKLVTDITKRGMRLLLQWQDEKEQHK